MQGAPDTSLIKQSIAELNAATNWVVAVPAFLTLYKFKKVHDRGQIRKAAFYGVGTVLMLCASIASSVYHLEDSNKTKWAVDVAFAGLLCVWTAVLFVWICLTQNLSGLQQVKLGLFCVVSSVSLSMHFKNNIEDEILNRAVHVVWHLLASTSILLLVVV